MLCNGTLTFYSLPELSPALNNARVSNCTWVGGVDLNTVGKDVGTSTEGEVIMISIKARMRLVRINEEARLVRNIEYPGCLASARRETFACVANAHSYSLLDVEHQQKIPLFPISSLDDEANLTATTAGQIQDISTSGSGMQRSSSSARPNRQLHPEAQGHGRSTSLGDFVGNMARRQQSPRARSQERSGLETPEPVTDPSSPVKPSFPPRTSSRTESPGASTPQGQRSPRPDDPGQKSLPPVPKPLADPLRPHICSPNPTEFLLTTGTSSNDPGVGMFVNLDGDVVRGTLEFRKYPGAIVTDGIGVDSENIDPSQIENQEGYVLASVEEMEDDEIHTGLEIQRWDVDPEEAAASKRWITIPKIPKNIKSHVGLASAASATDISVPEVGAKLRMARMRTPSITTDASTETGKTSDPRTDASVEHFEKERQLFESQEYTSVGAEKPLPADRGENEEADWESKRNKEEAEFVSRLGKPSSKVLVWSEDCVWWAVRNPLVLKLDGALEVAEAGSINESESNHVVATLDRRKVMELLGDIRGQEPRTETEFLTLNYIRQKASLLLFESLLNERKLERNDLENATKVVHDVLVEGSLDPRVPLLAIPLLRDDVLQSPKGIWIYNGLKSLAENSVQSPRQVDHLLPMMRQYLTSWRKKKGFGSIPDEVYVFNTVDVALLHLLLHADQHSPRGPATPGSNRAELNLVVDQGISNFDRAVELLEGYHRLYVLSRLWQSRKMSRKVLATWKRIVEGERDDGGELINGENEVRKYLIVIRDRAVVEEYGTWLASRNAKLGVMVFADESSRVKFEPEQVVELLDREAPGAVKDYLEYLVFSKHNSRYADNLIAYYLDIVISTLSDSAEARTMLSESYTTYRALQPPKPTYLSFITDNAPPDLDWWQSRLRLLQLLGSSQSFSYSVPTVLERIAPFKASLVSETIILDGRQGRHEEALRLLTHGLGDYDTAIRYCLLGGSSIFHPTSTLPSESIPSPEEQARLFNFLLTEFLEIEDISERIERTGELLQRFARWFEISEVLRLVPDEWSVEILSGFLVSALRKLVVERSEAMVTKALSGAENLRISADFVEKVEAAGPRVERDRID